MSNEKEIKRTTRPLRPWQSAIDPVAAGNRVKVVKVAIESLERSGYTFDKKYAFQIRSKDEKAGIREAVRSFISDFDEKAEIKEAVGPLSSGFTGRNYRVAKGGTSRRSPIRETQATTLRLRPEVREGLELLQAMQGVTMNKLMNDGLAEYVANRTAALESDLASALGRIREYRRQDPGFLRMQEEIAGDEAELREEDPVEGTAYKAGDAGEAGSSVSMVRKLIARPE